MCARSRERMGAHSVKAPRRLTMRTRFLLALLAVALIWAATADAEHYSAGGAEIIVWTIQPDLTCFLSTDPRLIGCERYV